MHVLSQLMNPAVQDSAHSPLLQRYPDPNPCVVLVQSAPWSPFWQSLDAPQKLRSTDGWMHVGWPPLGQFT